MKVGILSDTHGDVRRTRKAALALERAGVAAVFHCGDVGGYEILVELAEVFQPLEVPVHVVFGNCDRWPQEWRYFPDNIGIEMYGRFGEVELDGFHIGFLHSDDETRTLEAAHSGRYDFLFTGHSHRQHDFRIENTRLINPGCVGAGRPDHSAAILDMESGELSVFDL